MRSCAQCSLSPPAAKISNTPCVSEEFEDVLSNHFADFRTRIFSECEKAVARHHGHLHERIVALSRENMDLRQQLRLPPRSGSSDAVATTAFRITMTSSSPDEPSEASKPPKRFNPHNEERSHPNNTANVDTLMQQSEHKAVEALNTVDVFQIPALLRKLADSHEVAVEGIRNRGGFMPVQRPASSAVQQTDEYECESPAGKDNLITLDSKASMMVTVGNFKEDYKMFELWPTWTVEHNTFADRITTKKFQSDVSQNPKAPALYNGIDSATNVLANDETRDVCILSPTSLFCIGWNLIFMVILFYELVMMPMKVFEMPTDKGPMLFLSWLCAIYWSIDLVLTFFVGQYRGDGTVELARRKIVRSYLKSWFGPDLFLVTMDWMVLAGSGNENLDLLGFFRFGKMMRYVRALRILRVLRLRKMQEALRFVDDLLNSRYFELIKSMVLNILGVLLISHFIGCVWYFLGSTTAKNKNGASWIHASGMSLSTPWEDLYLTSLHWSLTQFTPGSMNVQPENATERAYAIIVLVFGMIIFSSIVSSITAATNGIKQMNARYQKQIWVLRKYLREQNISKHLAARVIRYSDTVIQPRQSRVALGQVELIPMLPQTLYMDLMLDLYDQYLDVHPLFSTLLKTSRGAIQKLCGSSLREFEIIVGDEIFAPGQTATSIYFLTAGRLTYDLEFPIKSEAMEAGQWCCEAVLWTPWVHQGRLTANTESRLLAVESIKFQDIMSSHRGSMWLPKKYGAEFVRKMNEMAGFFTDDPNDDVTLSDLLYIQSAVDLLDEVFRATSKQALNTDEAHIDQTGNGQEQT